MDGEQLRRLKPELELFLQRYAPLFGRSENHAHAAEFVQGLLGAGERRNIENIAEAVAGGVVRTMQKFISQGCWKDAEVLAELRTHVTEVLGDEYGTINVDETGFPKKGQKSVGVKRQYSGTLGRVDNCQVAVMANYCSTQGHTLIDRRLYLPHDWADDAPRRAAAGVPEGVIFRTKPELALEMVQQAAIEGVPFQWVGGDCVYGDSPVFVQGLRALEKWYVLDASSDTRVWLKQPEMRPAGRTGKRGGQPKTPKPLTRPLTIPEAVATLPASAYRRITVSEGSQGPIVYDSAELTVWFSEEGLPAEKPERLLVRRSLGQEPDMKYQRTNAPPEIPLDKVAAQRALRWTIEQDIQAGKGESGLDEYETRGWTGWHHHTALSLLALWFLVLQRARLGEKRAADDGPRSPRVAEASGGPAPLGRSRVDRVVELANGTQPHRQKMPRKKTPRRTAQAK